MKCPKCGYEHYRRYEEMSPPQTAIEVATGAETPLLKPVDYPAVVMTRNGRFCIICEKVIEDES